MQFKSSSRIQILLVEDNPDDVLLTKRCFKDCEVPNVLHVVGDGVEALDFLHKRDAFSNAARPDVILLDLNLPRKDGHTVLSEIKSDKELKHIPIAILTTSSSQTDIRNSYREFANCYMVKPLNVKQFSQLVRTFEEFWLSIAKLPSRGFDD